MNWAYHGLSSIVRLDELGQSLLHPSNGRYALQPVKYPFDLLHIMDLVSE